MSEPIRCVYCGKPWDDDTKRIPHMDDCYITTGVMTLANMRRKRVVEKARKALKFDDGQVIPTLPGMEEPE